MVSVTGVQNKLVTKVFNKIGSEVTITPYTSNSKNTRGDATVTYGTPFTSKSVPYNYLKNILKWEPFGDFQQGDTAIVLPHTTTIDAKDKITMDGEEWHVRELESFVMGDGTDLSIVATGLLLTRSL